jgi:hypothetical protein
MAKVTSLNKSKPSFNPSASYKWEPTDLFEITGQQLAQLYHCLVKEVHSVEGATVAQKYEAHQVIMELFKRGVEQGAIVEVDGIPEQVEEVEGAVNNLFKQ